MQCEQERGAVCEKKERRANAGKRDRAIKTEKWDKHKRCHGRIPTKLHNFLGWARCSSCSLKGALLLLSLYSFLGGKYQRERERRSCSASMHFSYFATYI